MTIKEVMQIGCDGFTEEQVMAEQERRLEVAGKLTRLAEMLDGDMPDVNKKVKQGWRRQFNRIKADESVWLKQVAWFIY